jgi:hypothetical protein
VIDPFDDLRDHLVHAITRRQTRLARTSRWAQTRSHPLAATLAALVFAGTATAGVISLTTTRSARLVGQAPQQAGPGSPHALRLEGGEHYRITVWPVLQGGVSGVCAMLVFEGPHGEGSGGCGAPYPTVTMPFLAPGGRIAYSNGLIPTGGALEYFLTGPSVAAVRIGTRLVIAPRREGGLPAGDRAVVFYLPAGSPQIDPPWFPVAQLGRNPAAKTLSVVAVGRDGTTIPIRQSSQQFRLPARYWQRPEKPPRGACALAAPSRYRALRGTTAVRLEPEPEVEGAALTSCLSVDYNVAGTPLTAAVLVNAKSPRSAAPAMFGATTVAGQAGMVNREENTGLHTSTRIAFTARRDGLAWIVVEGGSGLAERIQALHALRIVRIEVSATSERAADGR